MDPKLDNYSIVAGNLITHIIMAAQRDPHLHLRKTFLKVKVKMLSGNIQTVSGILFPIHKVNCFLELS